MDDGINWYILQVRSGQEQNVLKAIECYYRDLFVDVFIPSSHVVEKRKVLPGYIFIKMKITDQILKKFLSVHFVYKFLSQDDKPKIITQAEIDQIKSAIDDQDASTLKKEEFDIGGRVLISDGPFESYDGVIEDIDVSGNTCKVKILFFGRSVVVSFQKSQLKIVD